MIADFLLEFRFEFLWPFWLVIRSLHDSFKYQGIVSNSSKKKTTKLVAKTVKTTETFKVTATLLEKKIYQI